MGNMVSLPRASRLLSAARSQNWLALPWAHATLTRTHPTTRWHWQRASLRASTRPTLWRARPSAASSSAAAACRVAQS
eukprot:scaffold113276_cov69-Phaeocystis_antarctica.AAC.7